MPQSQRSRGFMLLRDCYREYQRLEAHDNRREELRLNAEHAENNVLHWCRAEGIELADLERIYKEQPK